MHRILKMNSYKSVELKTGLILLAGIWLAGCATPSSPTGGPPDKEGPEIIYTEPETGTINFTGQSITLHFSEFVERSSLRKAIVIEPDIGVSYNLDWGRKSAEIEFDSAIPDSTTLIVTVGTELSDTKNNGMASPRKVAVSTGSEIDEGKISGAVINAENGKGSEGNRILLYREPYELSDKADYVSSTDTSGKFEFSYLPEGKFKLFWVDDRNRNKIWDREQERAQPFSKEFIALNKSEEQNIGTIYYTATDTTKPVLQGVGLFSDRRMRMRFSENIQLTDSTRITVTDTLGNDYSTAVPLYIQPEEPYIIFVHSEEALLPESSYSLNMFGITDESVNSVKKYQGSFTGSSQKDTTRQRVIKRNRTTGYYPAEAFEITYAKPIDESAIVDSLKIIEGDTLIENWSNVETKDNLLRILPDPQWEDGIGYEVRIWDPIIEDYQKFSPDIWHQSQMGGLNIVMEDSTAKNIHLTIENKESGFARDTVFNRKVEIDNLPPLNYKLMLYQDQNANGQWDFGRVDSFVKPEPYFIQTRVPVEKDLVGNLTVEFPN